MLHDHQQELVRLDSNAVFDYPSVERKRGEREEKEASHKASSQLLNMYCIFAQ